MKRTQPKARHDGSRREVVAAATDPTGPGALEATCFHVSRAYFNYVALLERVLADLDLATAVKPGMGHVLFALFEHDDRIIKDLVQRTSLAPSTLTGILDKMARAELVTRVVDPSDRRAVRVALTRRGRSLRERCMKALERVNAVMEAGLSAAEVKRAKLALAAMTQAMQDEAREDRSPDRA